MKTKKELRREFSAKRAAAKSELRDTLIGARLLAMDEVLNADTVLIYASFGSEVNTWKIADGLLKRNITVAYPKCGDNGEMEFHVVSSLSQLGDSCDGKFGICEPDSSLPKAVITDRTVCIIPALALTRTGERLGYGGGYYDRYVAEHPGMYIAAIAYEAIITDELPQSSHDIRIDSIITEERLVHCHE